MLFSSLRFLHQLWVLSNKEAAFAVNEASNLHLSGIHPISSLFPPKSAAFPHVPVPLGRTRTGTQVSILGRDTKEFCSICTWCKHFGKTTTYCMYPLHDPNACHVLSSIQGSLGFSIYDRSSQCKISAGFLAYCFSFYLLLLALVLLETVLLLSLLFQNLIQIFDYSWRLSMSICL